ncbi:MAG: AAA family ATPase [Chloroflexi bacterium]|nr:AAA family ATPase [Chloroflexota bacterium]
MHLRSFEVGEFEEHNRERYPFSLPLVQARPRLEFDAQVTFLVGENGSGKSTLLEAIACAAGLPTAGEFETARDPTLAPARELAFASRLAWSKKTKRGLFLRAEDFFGFAKRMARLRADLAEERRQLDKSLERSSAYARSLARGALNKELGALQSRYGDGVDARSHGEAFLEFFRDRFVPDGLYLLDEPEAPLSPLRQLTLISLLKHMLSERAQFIIATHSPILMALPGAHIFEFVGNAIHPVDFNDVEHVRITRSFLANPDAFLQRL